MSEKEITLEEGDTLKLTYPVGSTANDKQFIAIASEKPYGCYKCGKAISAEDVRKIDGKTYCPEHGADALGNMINNTRMDTPDMSHQQHYESQKLQPIEIMLADLSHEEMRGFLKGNIIKYTLRAGRKQGTDDTAKVVVYSKWLDEFEKTNTIGQFAKVK